MKRFLVLFALALAGCGSSTDKIDEFGEKYEKALCGWYVRCGLATEAQCAGSLDWLDVNLSEAKAAIDAGRVRFEEAETAKCLSFIDGLSCEKGAVETAISLKCTSVFTGLVAPGAACFAGTDCQSGLCGQTDPECVAACCAGTCSAPVTLPKFGESCADLSCDEGLVCDTWTSTTAMTCASPGSVGGSCMDDMSCAAGLYCELGLEAVGTCQTLAAEGGACTSPTGCASLLDWCNPATSLCEKRKAVGASCTSDLECVPSAGCLKDACVEYAPAGGACDSENGPDCYGGFQCRDGTCQSKHEVEARICN